MDLSAFEEEHDKVKRGEATPIEWLTFDANLVMAAQSDPGAVSFQRTKYGEHDAALG